MKSPPRSAILAVVLMLVVTSCGSADPGESLTIEGGVTEPAPAGAPMTVVADQGSSNRVSEVTGARIDRRAMASLSRLRKRHRGDQQARSNRATTSTALDGTIATVAGSSSAGETSRSTGPSDSAGRKPPTAGPQATSTQGTATSTEQRTITTPPTATTEQQPAAPRRTTTTGQPAAGPDGGPGRFETLPPGAALPSGGECADRVTPRREVRSGNAGYNSTRGTKPNAYDPRVDGNFVGTTDEIIQWAACKWGIDEDWARAQVAKESWWDMAAGGDQTSDQSACHPDLRTGSGPCPESVGLMQVRYRYHLEAFEDSNAIRSSAYNIDYAYAVWRSCYNGEATWLNDVERGATYGAGDLEGCLGVWFSGRWYVASAKTYIDAVRDLKNRRVWESSDFLGYG